MRTLNLTLKKKWFDMIASGEKKEEYREIKPYWFQRLVFQYEKPFKYCTGYDYKDGLYTQEGIEHTLSKNFHAFNPIDAIRFRNGYSKDAPTILIECKGIKIGSAKPEWSDNWEGNVFIIKLGEVINEK